MIRRLFTYSPVETHYLEFEAGYWSGTGYEVRIGRQGVLVYETRPQDETLSTAEEWVKDLKADIQDLMKGRTKEFYQQLQSNRESTEVFLSEVEKMEWLHDSMSALAAMKNK